MTASGVMDAVRDTIEDALGVLARRRQRSFLALLGVAVGTAAVVAPVNIAHTTRVELLRQFDGLGLDVLVASAEVPVHQGRRLRADDLRRVTAAVPALTAAAPLILGSGTVAWNGRLRSASLLGLGPDMAAIARLEARHGRLLDALDDGAAVAVVGADLAAELGAPAVGAVLRAEGVALRIVGVLAPQRRNVLLPADFGRALLVPLGSIGRIVTHGGPDAVVMRMAPGSDDTVVARAAERWFAALGPTAAMRIESARQMIETMRHQMRSMSGMIAALGAVALIAGAVGVMNVMLMSVLERRAEIGLRVAVGATGRAIAAMFLAEAVVLSALGAVAGLAAGLAASWAYAAATGMALAASAWIAPLSLAVAVAVGLAAGAYPAVAAARLPPVVALRAGG